MLSSVQYSTKLEDLRARESTSIAQVSWVRYAYLLSKMASRIKHKLFTGDRDCSEAQITRSTASALIQEAWVLAIFGATLFAIRHL